MFQLAGCLTVLFVSPLVAEEDDCFVVSLVDLGVAVQSQPGCTEFSRVGAPELCCCCDSCCCVMLCIVINYLLATRVIGAPQIISQPVSSIFVCSPLPSRAW